MTYRGHVKNGQIALDKSAQLPEGAEVNVQVVEKKPRVATPAPAAQEAEDQLAVALRKKGIILTVPPKRTPEEITRFKAWKPIEMPGGSLSDELVRDRR